jgi:hypothetical protein
MGVSHQVTCIRKRGNHYNPHERIEGIGGPDSTNGNRYYITEEQAIAGIENGTWKFYTYDGRLRAEVIVAIRNGRKYLKTTADGEAPNNLLALPECPR